jgi:hypothetical protein
MMLKYCSTLLKSREGTGEETSHPNSGFVIVKSISISLDANLELFVGEFIVIIGAASNW